ncbi:hypothetical protein IT399_03285 [Candidatus Nomurabacteria bacterium]|nr:hypothetical protein [Candidatus Nomurabacteria bacterium]
MDRKKFFKKLASLIILIFLLNYGAVNLYWYSSIWYFDMIMHFLGGFWLSLFLIWLFSFKNSSLGIYSGIDNELKGQIDWKLIIKIIFSVLLVGIIWEFYEIVVNDNFAKQPFNALDTLSDIFFDLAGGVSALFYLFFFLLKDAVSKKEITV